MKGHLGNIDEIISHYQTDRERGLTAEQVIKKQEEFGKNKIKEKKKRFI